MNIDDSQLIELVRQFSIIYDPKHKDYRNNEQKSNAWKSISEVMNEPVDQCRDRWTTLRQIYSRELKKHKTLPSGSGADTKPWQWLREMSFLSDHVRRRKTKGNVPCESATLTNNSSTSENPWETMSVILQGQESQDSIEESEEEIVMETESQPEFVAESPDTVAESTESRCTPNKRKQTATEETTPNMSILRNERHNKKRKNSQETNLAKTITGAWSKFDNVLKQKSNENIEESDFLFGKMVGLEIATITDIHQKFCAKQQILSIIHEAKNP